MFLSDFILHSDSVYDILRPTVNISKSQKA